MQRERKHVVQFLIVREVAVEALDSLQAEREAYRKLSDAERKGSLAILVLEPSHGMGARGQDLVQSWAFARKEFGTIDKSWVA